LLAVGGTKILSKTPKWKAKPAAILRALASSKVSMVNEVGRVPNPSLNSRPSKSYSKSLIKMASNSRKQEIPSSKQDGC
jgi:hypothetical protein